MLNLIEIGVEISRRSVIDKVIFKIIILVLIHFFLKGSLLSDKRKQAKNFCNLNFDRHLKFNDYKVKCTQIYNYKI